MSYTDELAVAEEAARAAGSVLRGFRGKLLHVRKKADRTLVTDADLAAEEEILGRLRSVFPGDGIFAEESGAAGPEAARQWVVDPLDGTTNFSRGLPQFAVSIALWEGGKPAAAVVYLPALDELFAAVRGGAAVLNGEPIAVSQTATVQEAMVNVYFDRHAELEDGLRVFERVARSCEGRVKIMGSTASLLCYVACGRLDGFVRNRTKWVDFAAGALVLEAAGGRLTDFGEHPLRETGQSLLATNGLIHAALGAVVQGEEGTGGCR